MGHKDATWHKKKKILKFIFFDDWSHRQVARNHREMPHQRTEWVETYINLYDCKDIYRV